MRVSDLMQAMSEAGAPMEAILIAVRALEESEAQIAARDAETAGRRAKDAERKRIARDAARNVHGQSTDTDGTVPDAPPCPRPLSPQTPQTPTPIPPDITTRTRGADPFPCPEWAEAAVWRDLKANRQRKRLANTATAHAKLCRDILAMADDEWPPGRLLEAIVARGWGAAYDPREKRNDRKPSDDDQIRNPYARVAARQAAGAGQPSG